MNARIMAVAGLAAILLAVGAGAADIAIATVPVGDAGNTGEWSGASHGGSGSDRICGAVDYEFHIGKYEVTAGQYAAFLNAVAGVDSYGLYYTYMWSHPEGCKIERYAGNGTSSDPYQYRVASDRANRPVNYVSWGDAARFCNWLHNGQPIGAQDNSTTEDGAYFLGGAIAKEELLAVSREADWKWAIPSEDEWYKAAYYDAATRSYFDYPTSSNSAPGSDMADAAGTNANYHGTLLPTDSPYYTTLAGQFQNSESPYGTLDQGGNVWERNEAVIGSYRGLRGGSFHNGADDLHAAQRQYYGPTYEVRYVGFRVSEAAPEPATLSLLALGGLAVLRRRRRRVDR